MNQESDGTSLADSSRRLCSFFFIDPIRPEVGTILLLTQKLQVQSSKNEVKSLNSRKPEYCILYCSNVHVRETTRSSLIYRIKTSTFRSRVTRNAKKTNKNIDIIRANKIAESDALYPPRSLELTRNACIFQLRATRRAGRDRLRHFHRKTFSNKAQYVIRFCSDELQQRQAKKSTADNGGARVEKYDSSQPKA